MGRAAKVITIVGFAEPPPLTGRFAGQPAWRLGTVVLPPHIAGVRIKECPTVLALALSHRTCHGPASPQVHDRPITAWMEENGAGKDGESQRKKREEMERNDLGWKKRERGEPTGSPYPVNSSFRSPLTRALTRSTFFTVWSLFLPL